MNKLPEKKVTGLIFEEIFHVLMGEAVLDLFE
jgi:hypothetical protein